MPASLVARNVRLLFVFWFLREFQLWIPVWIVFLTQERGFSFTQVTAAEGLYLVGVMVLEVPTGAVADRFGRKVSLGLGAVSLASSVTIFAFTSSPVVLFVSFAWWAVASTLMSGADLALLFDTLKAGGREHEYERLAGRGTATTWGAIGLATLFGGPVAAWLGIRATVLIGAVTCLVAASAAFALAEPPRGSAAAGGGVAAYVRSIAGAFREVWANRVLRLLVLLASAMVAGLETVHYLVQPYLLDAGIEVGALFSLLQVPLFAAGMAGALLAGRIEARLGAVPGMLAMGAGGAAMLGVLALAPNLWAYGALPAAMAAGSCTWPLLTGAVNRQVDSARRATVLSIGSMGLSIGMAVLAPFIGYLVDRWGVAPAFALGAGAAGLGLVLFGAPAVTAARSDGLRRAAAAEATGT